MAACLVAVLAISVTAFAQETTQGSPPQSEDDPASTSEGAAPTQASDVTSDLASSVLIARAKSAHFTGPFSATVLCVRESYLGGRDTLRGLLESGRVPGERRLTLSGSEDAFEWWSRGNGGEQWRREGTPGRLRRLPPHSRKKPSFSPDVSYEDLARLPFGYLEGYRAVRRSPETDSTVSLTLAPAGALAALYGDLVVTLARRTSLLSKIVFTGNGSRPSKSMVVKRYAATPAGSFPAEITFASADGLSSTRLELTLLREEPARDKVHAPELSAPPPQPRFAEPEWVPRDPASR